MNFDIKKKKKKTWYLLILTRLKPMIFIDKTNICIFVYFNQAIIFKLFLYKLIIREIEIYHAPFIMATYFAPAMMQYLVY